MSEKRKVAIGLAHKGKVKSEMAEFLFQVESPEERKRHLLTAEGQRHEAYNKIIRYGLERYEDIEWFLLFTSQQVLNSWSLKYLVEEAENQDAHVVTPITFDHQFKFPIPVLHDIKERISFDFLSSTGLFEMNSIPTSCVLVHKLVIESLEAPWFEETKGLVDEKFSRKCRKEGFIPYINEDIVSGCVQDIDLQSYYDILKMLITGDSQKIKDELHEMIWSDGKEGSPLNE